MLFCGFCKTFEKVWQNGLCWFIKSTSSSETKPTQQSTTHNNHYTQQSIMRIFNNTKHLTVKIRDNTQQSTTVMDSDTAIISIIDLRHHRYWWHHPWTPSSILSSHSTLPYFTFTHHHVHPSDSYSATTDELVMMFMWLHIMCLTNHALHRVMIINCRPNQHTTINRVEMEGKLI